MLSRFARRSQATAFLGVGILAAALSAVAVAGSIEAIGKTFPGFVVWDNLIVVALGRESWSGIEARVPFRARVISVDGASVHRREEVLARVRRSPPGTSHSYRFEGPDGTVTLEVASMRLSVADYLATMGIYVLNGLVFLLTGLAVYYLKPDSRQSRALLSFGVIWGLTLVLAVDLFTAGRLQRIYFLLEALSPAAILHLGLIFPEPRRPLKASSRPLALLYGAALIVGIAQVYLFRRSYAGLLALNNAVYLAIAATGLFALASIALGAFAARSPLARRRARVVMAGAILAFLIPLLALLAFLLLGRPVSFSLLTLTGFVFPLAIGYAVARHDLFEADRFVKRSLAWAVITAIVSLGYALAVLAADRLAAGLALAESPLFPVAFALIALAVIVPLRERVQRGVDRLFYRSKVDYKRTVARVSEQMTAFLDREAIAAYVARTAREVLGIESLSLWERAGDMLVRRQETGGQEALLPLSAGDPGVQAFVRRAVLLSRDEVEESPRLRAERQGLRALFETLHAQLLVPLMRQRRVVGLLAAGPKGSGSPLSSDDLDVLRTLANEAAVALANAEAVEKLRAAERQIVQSERLVAIGELSAAVAHGIRNPLAGMRMAAQLGLEDAPPGHPVREYLEDVLTEVDKLEAQVRGILDFSRPFEPRLEPTDLRQLLESLIRTLRPKLESRRIAVRLEAPEGGSVSRFTQEAPPKVSADPAHLIQAFQALLVNAMEAIGEDGRITLEILEQGASPGRLRVAIEDTGPGIPAAMRERVFQLFMTTKSGGTGLGLAVVRKIIERHGGRISLEDAAGAGARFVVELPRVQGETT